MPTHGHMTALDYGVLIAYLLAMIGLGVALSRRQTSQDEYFLGSRRMPWFAVGMSVIASLLSSLTYLSEPGEVWMSGLTNFWGKMLAVALEIPVVWLISIPFLMRFRYTSAYEYLEARFSLAARRLGVAFFCLLVVAWMGFIVLASARAMHTASAWNIGEWFGVTEAARNAKIDLSVIILTIGVVATLYTVMGGLRAVIWTDVAQVALMAGGALFILFYIGFTTHSHPGDWFSTLSASDVGGIPVFDADPFVRATMLGVAINMFTWHVCTHTANQITVQRYFSTADLKSARRSFMTGSIWGVAINALLMFVGVAIFYFYRLPDHPLPAELDIASGTGADKVFPYFFTRELPPGMPGVMLAAVLAAAMSSIDSGINSLATVLTGEWERSRELETHRKERDHVKGAKILTFILGAATTVAAFTIDLLPMTDSRSNLVAMMPRVFNCFLTPMAGMFFLGFFVPRARGRAALIAGMVGLATSLGIAYGKELFGIMNSRGEPLSFTIIVPVSVLASFISGWIASLFDPAGPRDDLGGLTWFTRTQTPTDRLRVPLTEIPHEN